MTNRTSSGVNIDCSFLFMFLLNLEISCLNLDRESCLLLQFLSCQKQKVRPVPNLESVLQSMHPSLQLCSGRSSHWWLQRTTESCVFLISPQLMWSNFLLCRRRTETCFYMYLIVQRFCKYYEYVISNTSILSHDGVVDSASARFPKHSEIPKQSPLEACGD